ncbi:Dimethylaniline monooxygenase [N-oxide-forming] 5 [Collichthys lucidus]|uniref:Flavin-containing monooxygenase n=1 Tax=Collichthys lucidus TaxID=240159 RepID=A0A4U5UJF2_COLLU|nr:Dimethylaniline monooxygenase [N-oxide-forming] 5 [Collichthys lucidus]
MAFSDFPPPAQLPNNMHHSEVLLYLRLYAEAFKLLQHIQFQVYLSARSGAWVVSRVGEGGLPCDLLGSSRLDMVMEKLFPLWVNKMVENRLNKAFDHKLYGLKPSHSFFQQMPVVNDDLPARIISGRVQLKPNVKQFCGSTVVFTDGSVMDKVYLSARSGAWLVSRVGEGGIPADLVGTSRMDMMIGKLFPSWVNKMVENKLNKVVNHKLYGLQPNHG